jgi:prepilin-type processing-associated H-X9-DG protein
MNVGHQGGARAGLTLSVLVVVAMAILIGTALFLFTTGRLATCRGYMTVQCTNRLKQIYAYAIAYSDRSGRFPVAPGKSPAAHESLNELIAFDGEGLSPRIFTCEASDSVAQAPGKGENLSLSAESSSYAWTAVLLTPSGPPRPLASDKYADGFQDANGRHSGHRGGMNVLYTDGSVRFVREEDLDPETGLPPGLRR